MRAVRRTGTRAELAVRRWATAAGLRYRLNVRALAGTPDLANVSGGWAVFVHGCFWHAHDGCPRATVPKSNAAFWREKLAANRARDERKAAALAASGLHVVTVWECQALAMERGAEPPAELAEVLNLLRLRRPSPERSPAPARHRPTRS